MQSSRKALGIGQKSFEIVRVFLPSGLRDVSKFVVCSEEFAVDQIEQIEQIDHLQATEPLELHPKVWQTIGVEAFANSTGCPPADKEDSPRL